MENQFDLRGRRALITGSAEGIGKAIAQALAQRGAEVIIHDKEDEQKCRRVAKKLSSPENSAGSVTGDLQRGDDIERIFREVKEAGILVLNASIQMRKDFFEITMQEFDMQMHVNLWSCIRLIQLFHAGMKESGWGRILMIGSIQQIKPHAQMPVYAAGKSALANLALNLAGQFARDGITVNNLAPGVIETGRNTAVLANPEYAAQTRGKIPAGYFGQPEDCSGLALLLCSDAGRYITGQTIYCDGGMSL